MVKESRTTGYGCASCHMLAVMSARGQAPVGVVLAGAQQWRGGEDAIASLGGRPLLSYALDTMARAAFETVVVAERSVALPPLRGVTVWEAPAEPSHPLAGVAEALRRAGGRPVLVCAAELPFVAPELLSLLAGAQAGSAPATIACNMGGRLQPLLGLYRPAALEPLSASVASDVPASQAVAALPPLRVPVQGNRSLLHVTSDDELARAEQMLVAERGLQQFQRATT